MKLLALMMVGLCTVAAAQPAPKKAAAPAPKKKDAAPVDPYAEPKKAPAGPQDPYAQTASPNDAPGVPARVGLSDLTAVQGLLAVQRLDGWLLYDRDGSNPIAVRLVSPDGHPQRAWFYMIPARGEPVALVHVSERSLFDKLPGKKLTYLGYRDLGKQVAQLLKGVKSIAIEYSAKAAVPNISRVDAGTVELIRAAGVAVRSSDTLVQFTKAIWGDAGRTSHYVAVHHLVEIDLEAAMHLRAEAQPDIVVGGDDAGTGIVQTGRDLLGIVADGGDDAEAGDNHASHDQRILKVPEGDMARDGCASSRSGRQGGGGFLDEEADLEVLGFVDDLAVHFHDAVGDADNQLAHDHPLQIDDIGDFPGGGQHHAGEFHFPHAQGAALALAAHPAQEKAHQLPQRVQPQAARHHRIALEMALEEPEIGMDIELGLDLALALGAARVADLGDAVEHQHGRQRKLGIAGAEHLAPGAFQQVFKGEMRFANGLVHVFS